MPSLGDRLGTTQEAARLLARRLRLPRHAGNDGKARITIDLTEINYRPLRTRSPGDHRSDSGDLSARVEQLEGELARVEVGKQRLEVRAASHRADFERERERCDTLVIEALKLGKLAMSAREKAARLDGEQSAAWAHRRWWRRLVSPISRPAMRFDLPDSGLQCSSVCPFEFERPDDKAARKRLFTEIRDAKQYRSEAAPLFCRRASPAVSTFDRKYPFSSSKKSQAPLI